MKKIMLPDTEASYESIKRVLNQQGYDISPKRPDIGRLAVGMSLEDLAARHSVEVSELRAELDRGIDTEMEHTTDPEIARTIAMDHLYEDPKYYVKLQKMETNIYARGGATLNPDDPKIKEYFAGGSGDTGGVLVGRRHSEGGIKVFNKATGRPIEVEGGEIVITRDAVSDPTKREFEGEMLTNLEILSRINVSGGGVPLLEDGGHVCNCTGRKYNYGGRTMEDIDILREMARGGSTETDRMKRMRHYATLDARLMEDGGLTEELTGQEALLLDLFRSGKSVVPIHRTKVFDFDSLERQGVIYFVPSQGDPYCMDARLTPKGRQVIEGHDGQFAKGGTFDCGCGMYKSGGQTEGKKTYYKGIEADYPNQFELNKAIEEFLAARDGRPLTPDELTFISHFSGYGGLLKYEVEGKGILYEYYTPTPIVKKMWALAYKHGYDGGTVLEPAVGVGEFVKFAPSPDHVTAFEINPVSAEICRLLYPGADVRTKSFETLFIERQRSVRGEIENVPKFDLVIGNPPYGEYESFYAGMGEEKYTKAGNWIDYFILRGLDCLRPGGLLLYIIGGIGKPWMALNTPSKRMISEKCVLLDAYRLPDGLFERTEVSADIIVLQKR